MRKLCELKPRRDVSTVERDLFPARSQGAANDLLKLGRDAEGRQVTQDLTIKKICIIM